MNRDELTQLKKSLEEQAIEGLELHNKAIGALELLNHFLSQLEEEEEEA